MMALLKITCRDPIVSRDGRPFGDKQGNRMRSAGWPFPSMVAGSLRSTLGKLANRDFSVETAQELLRLEVAGFFPVSDDRMYLPAPHDCVVHPDQGPLRAAPQAVDRGGCDLPAHLRPVCLTREQASNDFKAKDAPAWWPIERYAAWLSGEKIVFNRQFLRAPEVETRTHVHLDSDSGAAEDAELFTTAALPLTALPRHDAPSAGASSSRFAEISLAVRVRADGWCGEEVSKLNTLHPLGGERRLAQWKTDTEASVWSCPPPVREALVTASKVRMILATPAVFRNGWKPGWLNDDLVGTPPGANVTLRLAAVSIQRWRAVSGWSLASLPDRPGHPGQPCGPKPVKRLVPSGGVYFFEIVDGYASGLADRWLEPVSDDEQDQRNGFGLATWGIW